MQPLRTFGGSLAGSQHAWPQALLAAVGRQAAGGTGDAACSHKAGRRRAHSAAEAQHEDQDAVLCQVVARKGASVLELHSREEDALLIGRDAPEDLDHLLQAHHSVVSFHVHSDALPFVCDVLTGGMDTRGRESAAVGRREA